MTKEDDIRSLDLSTRLSNSLINSGIRVIGQLTSRRKSDISELRGIGKKVLFELERQMTKYGFRFSSISEIRKPPYTSRQREILINNGLQYMVDERDALIKQYEEDDRNINM